MAKKPHTWMSWWGDDEVGVSVHRPIYGDDPPYFGLESGSSECGMAVHGDAEFARRFADTAAEWADAVEAYEQGEGE